jgi:hypothetical protein
MAKTFEVTTVSTTVLTDLGARTLTHPVVSLDLALEYTLEELRDSADLRAAIEAGTITVVFDGTVNLTSGALFDEYMVDFDHKQVKQNTDDIAALTGSKTWAYTFTEDKAIKGDRYLKTGNGVFSNLSPQIVPVACNLYGISVKSKDGVSVSYNIIVEDDGATAHTEAVTTSDSSFDGALSVAVAAGSEIAVKADHTGNDIQDVTVTVYFEAT